MFNRLKILDCTLRDGGYYNNWDFEHDFVINLLNELNDCGVSIVEIGYKSLSESQFYGLYRYCSESQLDFLNAYSNIEFAFMVDVKEFIDMNQDLDRILIKKTIRNQNNSVFNWCRIATYHDTFDLAIQLAGFVKKMGYKVSLNLMGVSLLTEEQFIKDISKIVLLQIDAFYFSDSFGTFVPSDISKIVALIRQYYDGALGIHTHENQGLAFANTLVAIESGVEFIDATIAGIGRGAGNLRLEQLLLALYFKYNQKQLNPFTLLDLINEHFLPLLNKYQWGWDFAYMLSGLKNIHPSYCQKLKSQHQYTINQVAQILTEIPFEHRTKFNHEQLILSSNKMLSYNSEEDSEITVSLPVYNAEHANEILIIAKGPSLFLHLRAIKEFAIKNKLHIIECNDTGALTDISRDVAVLNRVRLAELQQKYANTSEISNLNNIITGISEIAVEKSLGNMKSIPCKIEAGSFITDKKTIVVPGYIVGMYAIALALLSNPKVIYLAGFDGFVSPERREDQIEMESFWDLLFQSPSLKKTRLYSILPTTYNLPIRSVYALLD